MQSNLESLTTKTYTSPANEERTISKSSLFARPSIFGPLSMYGRFLSFFGISDGSSSDRGAGSS